MRNREGAAKGVYQFAYEEVVGVALEDMQGKLNDREHGVATPDVALIAVLQWCAMAWVPISHSVQRARAAINNKMARRSAVRERFGWKLKPWRRHFRSRKARLRNVPGEIEKNQAGRFWAKLI